VAAVQSRFIGFHAAFISVYFAVMDVDIVLQVSVSALKTTAY